MLWRKFASAAESCRIPGWVLDQQPPPPFGSNAIHRELMPWCALLPGYQATRFGCPH
jgi:hypothetical protein